jgi:steroid 5-alpha reductase family enzyme
MTSSLLPHLAPTTWGLVWALSAQVILWLISLRTRDVSIVDMFWGPGIAGVVDIAALVGQAGGNRTAAVLFLVNLWGLRLAAHIWARHTVEDYRYAEMRQKHGPRWWWVSLFNIFLLQGVLMWFVPAPLVAAVLYSNMPIGWLDYAGIAVAGVALVIESLADFQLTAFRADPGNKGKVMDRGLWGWSRHPNYFGETMMWWGYFAIGFGASHQWWLILSPVLMTFLLLQVSGVTLLEEKIDERRPGYADYKRRVSAFIPWPSKRV